MSPQPQSPLVLISPGLCKWHAWVCVSGEGWSSLFLPAFQAPDLIPPSYTGPGGVGIRLPKLGEAGAPFLQDWTLR
jgi:hypothetical protein